jgi:hypothetical protein
MRLKVPAASVSIAQFQTDVLQAAGSTTTKWLRTGCLLRHANFDGILGI